ncbi:hypothetical protein [Micromonospora maritima]|uniref:hypothetical protein n=1 Tax=Micromonospora maritima TaxID=986711 RepID=UPI00157C5568|nr:hypothetical protein [Micromonospora maritima]
MSTALVTGVTLLGALAGLAAVPVGRSLVVDGPGGGPGEERVVVRVTPTEKLGRG